MKASWNGQLIAESTETIIIEGNHYFPPSSINREFFKPSDSHTLCPWKGVASYYNVLVDGQENSDAAWFYSDPKDAAAGIKNFVAFWKGVKVEK